jgi:integrase
MDASVRGRPERASRVRVERKLYRVTRLDGSRYYQVEFYDHKFRRVREYAGETLTDARNLRTKRDHEVQNETYVHRDDIKRAAQEEAAETAKRVVVSMFLDTFLREYPGRKRSDHYQETFRYLRLGLGDLMLRAVTRADLERFAADLREKPGIKGRPLSPATIRKVLSVTKTVFKWATERGDLDASPAVGIKKPGLSETTHRTRYLSREEWARLEAVASPALRPMLTLAVNTGMRLGEVALLRWGDVDLRGRLLHVPQDTKTGTRPVPLNATAKTTLEDLDRLRREVAKRKNQLPEYVFVREDGSDYTSPADRNRLSRAAVNAMRGAGIPGATFHTLRHTAASWMVAAGVPLYEVGKILGHSTPLMTQRYAHLTPDHLRNAVAALDGSGARIETFSRHEASAASATSGSPSPASANSLNPQ